MKSYDPQMHTAEHILNQTMVRMFNCGRAFSSHLERKKSKCDYHFSRALSQEEEEEIVTRVNDILASASVVTTEMMSRSEAEKLFNLSRLPEDASDGEIRVVCVGQYDACPCIGEHVKNTCEVGVFRLVSSSFGDGVLRIRFKLDRP